MCDNGQLRFQTYFNYVNQHQNDELAERNVANLLTSKNRSSYFTALNGDSSVCGASVVIKHAFRHIELGGTLVTQNGLGLQRKFYWLSVFTELLQEINEGPQSGEIFLVCKKSNKRSCANIQKAGFVEFNPDRQFLLDVTDDVSEERISKYRFFHIPKTEQDQIFQYMAKQLIDVFDNPDIGEHRLRFHTGLFRTPQIIQFIRDVAAGKEVLQL